MRYYCENCRSEIITPFISDHQYCPFCEPPPSMSKIPDYETPERYEKRTGEKLSLITTVYYKRKGTKDSWLTNCWEKLRTFPQDKYWIVVASPPVPPSKDWEPEECVNEYI